VTPAAELITAVLLGVDLLGAGPISAGLLGAGPITAGPLGAVLLDKGLANAGLLAAGLIGPPPVETAAGVVDGPVGPKAVQPAAPTMISANPHQIAARR
jgi:hypothetical protein